jgi:uncharacterized protein YjbI with pentapeptide repeats
MQPALCAGFRGHIVCAAPAQQARSSPLPAAFRAGAKNGTLRGVACILPAQIQGILAMRRSLAILVVALAFLGAHSAQAQNCTQFNGKVDLRNCSFTISNFSTSNFSDGDLRGASFTSVNLSSAKLVHVKADKAHFVSTNLSKADMSGGSFVGASFQGSNLSSAKLVGADLRQADFTGANMLSADFTKANLTGANFAAGNYTKADFTGATWTDGKKICGPGSVGTCR